MKITTQQISKTSTNFNDNGTGNGEEHTTLIQIDPPAWTTFPKYPGSIPMTPSAHHYHPSASPQESDPLLAGGGNDARRAHKGDRESGRDELG